MYINISKLDGDFTVVETFMIMSFSSESNH